MSLFRKILDEVFDPFQSFLTELEKETNFKIRELKILSEDGKTQPGNGVCYYKGGWYKAAKENGEKFDSVIGTGKNVFLFNGEKINEAVAADQYGLENYAGGTIVFALDVNIDLEGDKEDTKKDTETDKSILQKIKAKKKEFVKKVKLFFKFKLETLKNKLLKSKKLSKIINKYNLDPNNLFKVGAFSEFGKFRGRYASEGKIFDESSSAIEILSVPSEVLLIIATIIAKEFKQHAVLVKDLNTNRFYLADSKDIENVDSEVKKTLGFQSKTR